MSACGISVSPSRGFRSHSQRGAQSLNTLKVRNLLSSLNLLNMVGMPNAARQTRASARTLGALLLLAAAAPWPTALAVPPAEQLPPNLVVPAAGLIAGDGGWNIAATDDAVVLLGGSTSAHCVMYSWVRTTTGGEATWQWDGAITLPGMPASSYVSSANRSVVSDRKDTFVVTRSSTQSVVVRRTPRGWEYRGSVPVLQGSSNRFAVNQDAIVRFTQSYNFDGKLTAYRRDAQGSWPATAELPTVQGPVRDVVSLALDGETLLVSGYFVNPPNTLLGSIGSEAIPMSADWTFGVPEVFLPARTPNWHNGGDIALDEGWLATKQVAVGETSLGTVWYGPGLSRSAPSQWVGATGERPLAMRRTHMVTTRGVWTRDPLGTWHRGAELASSACLMADDDCVSLTAQQGLSIWTSPYDLDRDGVDDGHAIALGSAPDCNLNGIPDAEDIARGLLPDSNGNGVPDTCEADCDGDGIADLTQIRQGAPTACASATVLASCAIASGAVDVNGDGIVDACGPDADGDGTPDATAIASGKVWDCDRDGLPDALPYYRFSAATNSGWFGTSTNPTAWRSTLAVWYRTDDAHRVLNGIAFKIWSNWLWDNQSSPQPDCDPIGRPYAAFIFSDPNGDGVPNDAELLWQGIGVMGASFDQYIAAPSVEVQSPGFFVGLTIPQSVSVPSQGGSGCAGWYGTVSYNGSVVNDAVGRAFFALTSAGQSLGAPIDPGILKRSSTTPRIRVFSSMCLLAGDINGDGIVNGADLGILLVAWGVPHQPGADLNQDGSVDAADLGILLAAWGTSS